MMMVIIVAGLVAGGGWPVEDCWADNEHLTVSVCLLLTALCTAIALWAICCSQSQCTVSAKSFLMSINQETIKVQMNGRKRKENEEIATK